MKTVSKALFCLALACAGVLSPIAAAQSDGHGHSFVVEHGQFLLDGKPFQIISGEMHYARVPRAYWRDRLRMAKAMGLNSITTYVFWNEHEPKPGVFDFTGNNDVAEFVREAQEEGLYVILRPGPYSCAEWEFGGFPAWLLKDHSMVVRSSDPKFVAAARTWLLRLGKEVSSLQIGNGGPIIAVQVENEYGSYGSDHVYMEAIHHILLDAGFTKAQMYTADGADQLPNGSLPELPAVINFGTGDAKAEFPKLKKLRPEGPFMSGEYWAGWFDHWGAKHETRSPQQEADEIGWMLRQGFSVSLYMFHGGTSFGWMNGANSNGTNYEPDVTSYDYDSPLDESGRVTPKYLLLRTTIAEATGKTPPPVPSVPAAVTIAPFSLAESASLWETLPSSVHFDKPATMEDLNQAYGYILYRTTVSGPVQGELSIKTLHDYAQVYVSGKLAGTIDRRLGQHSVTIDVPAQPARLDILVENTGRVNYGHNIPTEQAGIVGDVTLGDKPLQGWEIFPLPMLAPDKLPYRDQPCSGACFYRGTFEVVKAGDTFLDTSAFTKGEVWVNGHALGRVWDVGPQKALYLPGPWLHEGKNEVVVFDINGEPGRTLQGLDHPVLDAAVK